MLDRLIDLLLQWVGFFVPFVVIDQFEQAVVLRFGKYQRDLEPGFHWIWPFQIDRVIADNVVVRTTNLVGQSLTTKDGKTIIAAGVVTSSISNIRKATLEVETVDQALRDSCYGAIGLAVAATDWDDIRSEPFVEVLTKACRKNGWRYGIEIERVQLSDLAPTKAISLHQG